MARQLFLWTASLALTVSSCGPPDNKTTDTLQSDNSSAQTTISTTNTDHANRQMTGIYEYVYPHNTSDLIENHYIKLEASNGKVIGTYYGTSDDFDEAREEYLPGFFQAKMLQLTLTDTTINFILKVNSSDIFTKAITPDDSSKNNQPWTVGVRYNERAYNGKIIGDSLIINTKDFDTRVFIKRK